MAPRAYWKGYLKLSLVFMPHRPVSGHIGARENQLPSAEQEHRPQDQNIERSMPRLARKWNPLTSSRDTRLARANISSLSPRSWKLWRSRASGSSTSMSLSPETRSPDGEVGQQAFKPIDRPKRREPARVTILWMRCARTLRRAARVGHRNRRAVSPRPGAGHLNHPSNPSGKSHEGLADPSEFRSVDPRQSSAFTGSGHIARMSSVLLCADCVAKLLLHR